MPRDPVERGQLGAARPGGTGDVLVTEVRIGCWSPDAMTTRERGDEAIAKSRLACGRRRRACEGESDHGRRRGRDRARYIARTNSPSVVSPTAPDSSTTS